MASLRAEPPAALGGDEVDRGRRPRGGLGRACRPTDGLLLPDRRRGSRVIVRPSGTEPKLKCYLEAVVPVDAGDLAGARAEAARRLAAMKADLPGA